MSVAPSRDPWGPEFSADFGAGAAGVWVTLPPISGTTLELTDLIPGGTYSFQVSAINAEGSGPSSPVLTITI